MGRIDKAMRRARTETSSSASGFDSARAVGDSSEFEVTEPAAEGASRTWEFRSIPRTAVSLDSPAPVPMMRSRPAPSDEIQLWKIVRALKRRWGLIVLIVGGCLAAAAGYNMTATPLYQARARIVIDPSAGEVVTFRPVATVDQRTVEYFQTQVQVLRSRALAEKTLEKLGRAADAGTSRSALVDEFSRSLSVAPVLGSRLVDVIVVAPDPDMAARAANAHAEAYVEGNLETIARPSREASEWLTERLAELRKEVDASQNALQQYREARSAIPLEDRQNIDVQKLGQLNEAVTRARTERIAKQALFDQLRAMQANGQPLDSFPPILTNSFVQQLKAELANLQRQRAQLAEQLGDLHPDMIKVDTTIAEAERRLNVEIARVIEGVRSDFNATLASERGLLDALAAQQRAVIASNRTAIGYGALQRDAASTQQIFEGVLQRFKEADLSAELQTNNVRVMDAAVVPRAAVWPRKYLNLMVALFGGLFIAVGLVLGLEFMNRRIESPDDIEPELGVPLLGVAPRIARPLKQLEGPESSVPTLFREAVRDIRARILLSPLASGVRTLVITSTGPGEGKTVVANNLAMSMARAGRRVLLIDADMRRPRIHTLHGLSRFPGLSDVLTGGVSVETAVQRSSVDGLFILAAGATVGNPADLLETQDVRAFLNGLRAEFDLILIDSPPLMPVADTSILANAASAALFVIGAGSLTKETLQTAIDRLTSVQAQVIGVVLNKMRPGSESGGYAYGYGYVATDDDDTGIRPV